MGNWAELPEDILVLIAKKITLFEDFLFFSGVCRSWRSVATNDNFKGFEKIPWLMLSDKDKPDERQFVSQRKGGVIRTVNLPQARGTRCLETLGWLVTLAEDGEMNLLHPFTRVRINLPHVSTFKGYDVTTFYKDMIFIHKAVLSSRPEEGKDYVLVVIHGWSGRLAFWRPEVDMSWHDVEAPVLSFCDVIFHDGLFYGVKGEGMVFAFYVWGPYRIRPWLVPSIPDRGIRSAKQLFIVESAGAILLVALMVIQDSSRPNFGNNDHFGTDNRERYRIDHRTWQFRVFKAVLGKNLRVQSSSLGHRRWVEIKSLGYNALFLGDNTSVSVDASRYPGIRPNCIYYTNNLWQFHERTGIYCLEDGSKSPCYKEESFNLVCAPMWVNPSSF